MRPPRSIVAIVVLSAVLVRTADSSLPEFTHGPMLGAVSDRSIKVWARLDHAGRFRVRYWPKHAPQTVGYAISGPAAARGDFTAVAVLDGLQSSTRYEYQLDRAGPGGAWTESPQLDVRQFRTLRSAGRPGKLRFVVGADIANHNAPGLAAIRKLAPDFVLLLGDNIYKVGATSLDSYRARYRTAWRERRMRELLADVPTFMIWDDHEIRDNFWPGRDQNYPYARQAYEEYEQSHDPDPIAPGELYYRVVAGDVEIFMLDERAHRDPNGAPDGPDKSMLGAVQKRALLQWLRESPARLKVIASPVTFSRYAMTGRDSWNGFAHERQEIFDAIAALRVPSVLIVSGDQHWNALLHVEHRYRDLRQSFYELLATPLAAHHARAPSLSSAEFIARDDDADAFGVVEVDTTTTPIRVALTMCDGRRRCRAGREKPPSSPFDLEGAQETVPYTLVLRGTDLGPMQTAEPSGVAAVVGNH